MRLASLSGVGLFSAFVYFGNAVHYGWIPIERRGIDDALAWLTAIVLALLYWAGFRILQKSAPLHFRQIMLWAIPLALISFLTIPYDSTDVFLYMDAGWEQAHYGLNPYTHVLRDIPGLAGDPIIQRDWMRSNKNPWLDLPFVYGFTFAWIVKQIAWLGNGSWWLTLGFLKLLNLIAYAVTARLLWSIARTLEFVRFDLPVYLFAWSPLILQHHLANVHNDLLVGSLVVLSVYLLLGRCDVLAPSAVVLATLIKYATLPLVPLTFWFIARRKGWPRASASAIIAVFAVAAVSAPYVPELHQFRFDLIGAQLNKVTAGSLYAFGFYLCRVISPASLATFGFVLKIALWITSAIVIGVELAGFCRKAKPSIADLIRAGTVIMFAVIFIASAQFYSWYLGMFFPLALLLPSVYWLRSFMVCAATSHTLSLTSLSRKGIGYFVVTTGLAALGALGAGASRIIPSSRPWRRDF